MTSQTGIESRGPGDTPDGSMVIAARISQLDLRRCKRGDLEALEEAMRNALGVIVGAEFRMPWHRRARAAVAETFRVLRIFLAFLLFLGLFVAALRVIVWVVVLAWGLLPV